MWSQQPLPSPCCAVTSEWRVVGQQPCEPRLSPPPFPGVCFQAGACRGQYQGLGCWGAGSGGSPCTPAACLSPGPPSSSGALPEFPEVPRTLTCLHCLPQRQRQHSWQVDASFCGFQPCCQGLLPVPLVPPSWGAGTGDKTSVFSACHSDLRGAGGLWWSLSS